MNTSAWCFRLLWLSVNLLPLWKHSWLGLNIYPRLARHQYLAFTHHSRIGTCFAQSSDDWRQLNSGQQIGPLHITGRIRAFGPGRLNYHFDWEGPSFSIDTACSGSSAAIYLAATALQSRQCDTAVAQGANIMTATDLFARLRRGGFLSDSGPCKTWDQDVDGYCRGDRLKHWFWSGWAMLWETTIMCKPLYGRQLPTILQRQIDNLPTCSNPRPTSEERQRDADLDAGDIGYIEMHGTEPKLV